jgi:hypothetical protein
MPLLLAMQEERQGRWAPASRRKRHRRPRVGSPMAPGSVARSGGELSRWLPAAAIAGIGVKTQLKELVSVGLKAGSSAYVRTIAVGVSLNAVYDRVGKVLQSIGVKPE